MFKVKRLLPLLFTLVLLFCSAVPVQAAEQYGTMHEWTGDIAFSNPACVLHLDSTYTQNTVNDDTNTNNVYTTCTYKGTAMLYADFQSNDTGYMNGTVFFPITFELIDNNVTQYYVYATLDDFEDDGVKTWCSISSLGINSITLMVYFEFTNYALTGNEKVPLNFNVSYARMVNSNLYGVIGCKIITPTRSDWAGSLTVYSDIRDTPGYQGDIARQNQEIIDGIDENTSAVKSIGNNIVSNIQVYGQSIIDNILTQFSNLTSNLSDWYNGLTVNLTSWFDTLFAKLDEDQDELINGYDPGTGFAAKNEFDSSAAELEAAEGDLFGQTSYDQVDYTQFNSFFSIEAVAASMLFVKSILESLYGALGVFGVPITIGLVLLVFTRIIGFQNFYSGGD